MILRCDRDLSLRFELSRKSFATGLRKKLDRHFFRRVLVGAAAQ
jgi:hypothetical protein